MGRKWVTPRPAPASAEYAIAAVAHMSAIAREHGLMHYTAPRWAVCSCTDGTHPWTGRSDTSIATRAWDAADAANRSLDGPPAHVVVWESWYGSSPTRIADAADREARA